ncbi:MAG: methyl-accepting chemotaxis protein [Thiobacillaceae bacterium]
MIRLLNQFTIGTRLLGLTLFLSVMMLVTGLSGLWGIRRATETLTQTYEASQSAIDQLQDIRYQQATIRNLIQEARLSGDAFAAQEWFDEADKRIRVVSELIQSFGQRSMPPEEKRLFDQYADMRMRYGVEGIAPIRDMLAAEDFDRAAEHFKTVLQPATAQLDKATNALIAYVKKEAQGTREKIAAQSEALQAVSMAVMAIGLIMSVILSLLIRRSIVSSTGELERASQQFATGDLSDQVRIDGRDELARLGRSFNAMAGEFSRLIGEIRRSAEDVNRAAQNTASNSAAVAENSNRQAALAQDTAVAAQEMADTIARVGDNIVRMVAAADQASQRASHGETVVNDATQGIQAISRTVLETSQVVSNLGRQSGEIGRIVSVIKDIADQTNLLALNAAIEAARAGEQGRGFAVVADEVRKLAERTSSATNEISSTIQNIQQETARAVAAMEQGSREVSQGVDKAQQVGQAIVAINEAVSSLSAMIHDIGRIRAEQEIASRSIATRVEEIHGMAGENRTVSENSAHAARELTNLAEHLRESVSRFKLAQTS